MRTKQSLISNLRLLRQCLLLGFLLTPVMAVGQDSDIEQILQQAEEGNVFSQYWAGVMYSTGPNMGVPQDYAER